jgi:IS30 family transposase
VAEREEVSRGITAGLSSRAIAARIGRSASTVSREIARNGGRERYRATVADNAAWERARRPKPSRLSSNPALLAVVRERLEEDWSPEQIAVRLKRVHPDAASMRVSHETIYRTISLAGRRELGPRPAGHLRSGRSVCHVRRVKQSHGRGVLRNMVSIRQRPVAVTERVEVGHWEGDLVMGKRPSAVATLVERSTRYRRVVLLPDGYKATAISNTMSTTCSAFIQNGIGKKQCDQHGGWQQNCRHYTHSQKRTRIADGCSTGKEKQ